MATSLLWYPLCTSGQFFYAVKSFTHDSKKGITSVILHQSSDEENGLAEVFVCVCFCGGVT